MYYKALIQIEGEESHVESFSTDKPNPNYVAGIIARFNATLRPGEKPRKLLAMRSKFNQPIQVNIKHDWRKKSLVTENGGYDVYKCSRCGALGKRFGLSPIVTPDKKYTQFCKI